MTLEEAMKWADESAKDLPESSIVVLTAEVRRLQSATCKNCSLGHMSERIAQLEAEATNLRLYAPARRAQPTVKPAPIGPTKHKKWGIVGIIDETDDEFAERAGRKVAEDL